MSLVPEDLTIDLIHEVLGFQEQSNKSNKKHHSGNISSALIESLISSSLAGDSEEEEEEEEKSRQLAGEEDRGTSFKTESFSYNHSTPVQDSGSGGHTTSYNRILR